MNEVRKRHQDEADEMHHVTELGFTRLRWIRRVQWMAAELGSYEKQKRAAQQDVLKYLTFADGVLQQRLLQQRLETSASWWLPRPTPFAAWLCRAGWHSVWSTEATGTRRGLSIRLFVVHTQLFIVLQCAGSLQPGS